MATTAAELNDRWDVLMATYDKYFSSLPGTVKTVVDSAITQWQNFYFGQSGVWSPADLTKWDTIFVTTAATLKAGIPNSATPDTISSAKPIVSKQDNTVFSVRGARLPWKYGWLWVLIPTIPLVYYVAKKF